MSLVDELQSHRKLALERAQMEANFEIKLKALEKVKSALATAPDLDVDKVVYLNSLPHLFEKQKNFLELYLKIILSISKLFSNLKLNYEN